jgi:hypothetical protein
MNITELELELMDFKQHLLALKLEEQKSNLIIKAKDILDLDIDINELEGDSVAIRLGRFWLHINGQGMLCYDNIPIKSKQDLARIYRSV